jgi:2-acylglycerol O-acyltransferase 2
MNHLLSHPKGGQAAVLIPGGAPESLDSHPGSYIVQLKNKKGFIKVAMQNESIISAIFSNIIRNK